MRSRFRCALLCAVAIFAGHAKAAPVPVEAFTDDPAIDDPQLTYDGSQVIFLTSSGRQRAIADYHVDSGTTEVLCMVDSRADSLAVKGNNQILFTTDMGFYRILRSVSPGAKSLNRFSQYGDNREIDRVVDWMPADPDHILVRGFGHTWSTNVAAALPQTLDIFSSDLGLDPRLWTVGHGRYGRRIGRMDLRSGAIEEMEPVEANTIVGPYVADSTGTLRLRSIMDRDRIEIQARAGGSDEFRTVHSFGWDEPDSYFLGFGSDQNVTYFETFTDNDLGEVRAFDLRTSTFGPVMQTFPGRQVGGLVYSRDHSRILGAVTKGPRYVQIDWIDEKMKRMQAAMDASLPGRRNVLFGESADEGTFIIRSFEGGSPGEYFVFNRARRALVRLGPERPALGAASLATPSAQDITARDGFVMHAVLTTPVGRGEGPWPMVVIPQPAPFIDRSYCGYNGWCQFLASRGYATLQVDYRGAWGYGYSYMKAGYREVTGKMLDDIEDATRWCVRSGRAREGRIAIMGVGTGASLSMMAAVRTPDAYCCVVNVAGDPDLVAYSWDNYDWLTRKHLERDFGDDKDAMAKASLLAGIDRLKAPIMSVYDNPDHNITWGRLETALRRHGKRYVLMKNLDIYTRPMPVDERKNLVIQIEGFLAQTLPPG